MAGSDSQSRSSLPALQVLAGPQSTRPHGTTALPAWPNIAASPAGSSPARRNTTSPWPVLMRAPLTVSWPDTVIDGTSMGATETPIELGAVIRNPWPPLS
jgi:hypothetical protein